MSGIEQWLLDSPKWASKHCKVIKYAESDKIVANLKEVLKKSEDFPINFPIDTIRNKILLKTVPKRVLERNVQSVYPIIHEAALYLCAEFLLLKRKHGSNIEKKFYKDMTVLKLINRLLIKRAIMFIGAQDCYMLRDRTIGMNNKWELIGTDKEKNPLVLADYLSYDELKLSAFLSVSSYSYFINDGSRKNKGIPDENRENIESEGIIIGLIGTRLRRQNAMEYQDIVLSTKQKIDYTIPNVQNLFHNFYRETSLPYTEDQLNDENRFKDIKFDRFFDNAVYAKRLAISFDTLLLEANHRAQERGKFAYVHVVGIGLGVWRISEHQEACFLHTFGNRIRALGSNLNFVSDIDFSYFTSTECLGYGDGSVFPIEGHPHGGIKIHISRRQPFSKLENDDLLLVVSYAWDSNAHPGNEFWDRAIDRSGDSATAASSQVSELHNAGINPVLCADNLMLATPRGVVPAKDYLKQVMAQIDDGQDVDVDEDETNLTSWFSCNLF